MSPPYSVSKNKANKRLPLLATCFHTDYCSACLLKALLHKVRKDKTKRNYDTGVSRDSSVGIATRLWAGRMRGQVSIPGRGTTVFSSRWSPDRLWSPSSLLCSYSWYRRVKRQGLEANNSPVPIAEARNGGAIPPIPNSMALNYAQG